MAQQRPDYATFVLSEEDEIPNYVTDSEREKLVEELHYAERDGRSILVIVNGNSMETHTEGEPEDASFARDYSWITEALEDAYKAGKRAAKRS